MCIFKQPKIPDPVIPEPPPPMPETPRPKSDRGATTRRRRPSKTMLTGGLMDEPSTKSSLLTGSNPGAA